MKMKLHKVARD
ncbi:unnamed protein product [Rhodiola kirilowii]